MTAAAAGPAERARRRAAALPGSDALARLAEWTHGWTSARTGAAIDGAMLTAIALQVQADAGVAPQPGPGPVDDRWRLEGWLDLPAGQAADRPAGPTLLDGPEARRLWALRPTDPASGRRGPVLFVAAGGPGGPELWDRRSVVFLADELRRDAAAAEAFAALAPLR